MTVNTVMLPHNFHSCKSVLMDTQRCSFRSYWRLFECLHIIPCSKHHQLDTPDCKHRNCSYCFANRHSFHCNMSDRLYKVDCYKLAMIYKNRFDIFAQMCSRFRNNRNFPYHSADWNICRYNNFVRRDNYYLMNMSDYLE